MRNLFACILTFIISSVFAQPTTRPLPGHPGNVFLSGEDVVVPLPAGDGTGWEAIDYDGKSVGNGQSTDGSAALGKLPVGYYELRRKGATTRAMAAVLAPLTAPTPPTSPIGVDVAMAWFYKAPQMPAVASLCKLAGTNHVRDRLSWGEVEPKKDHFAPLTTRYDASAAAQSSAGLRVLQVNHSSAGWANPDHKRFPPDLRDAYRFHREMARRWKGHVLAFEPWNEADIDMFGGHTGAEMASLQKASYLGLKADNPDVIACLNVFAINRPATLDDLDANEAWPYFDTCNLHHYINADQYPGWYGSFRRICAGRPMWVSEFSMPVKWSGDKDLAEPTDEDLRVQAQRVPMVFAASLHEGPQACFYFLLPHYIEGQTQFGVIHKDLTPRPAYLALAAVGRLLADARPVGRLKSDDVKSPLHAFVFCARPDGIERDVLVAWSNGAEQAITLPGAPLAAYDHLGRLIDGAAAMTITKRPTYALLPSGSSWNIDPAPTMPPMKEGKPSPIVLQAVLPKTKTDVNKSAYRITGKETIPVFAYNFSEQPAKGTIRVQCSTGWKAELPGEIEMAGGERKELALSVEPSGAGVAAIHIDGDFGAMGKAVLSLRVEAGK